ncbi:serine hydrolase [Prosthecomicrobium pneumaticum]|uniref:Beta-lactamase class A n=1 Tax=Prosthecomicrobium pneumaticum TaxID=81895 RepID=A0A7W9FJA7_9HYPH|nr:serine hydrolase [Prosthecomicrobium pneumaticum]MBB5751391.1 beta-lactamase class A [Prosthecomicrobium pneumaticum]
MRRATFIFWLVLAGAGFGPVLRAEAASGTAAVVGSASATMTPEAAIARLFEQPLNAALFSADFLAAIPMAEIERLVAEMRAAGGDFTGVRGTAPDLTIDLERSTVPARIVLDAEGRVAGLWLGAPAAKGGLDALAAEIAALPGRTSLLVTKGGAVEMAHEADTPLAVGSAFKLAVLAALDTAVTEGRLAWADVVAIDPAQRSLPSGILQDWPDASPVTIATLANLMISVSDNTATDLLIHRLGREAVEAQSPRNTPFLTTREAFVLKADETLSDQWASGDAKARQALLKLIEGNRLPAVEALDAVRPAVEWFMSATELCGLLERTADLPPFRIDPGPARGGPWTAVAYKGGSEPGVLNFSSRVVDADGAAHCVVVSWNDDKPLDEGRLLTLYRGLLAALAERG